MIQVVQQPAATAEKPARETGRMQPSSAIQEAGAGAETKLEDALETISQLTARVEQLEADVMRIDRDAPQELGWGYGASLRTLAVQLRLGALELRLQHLWGIFPCRSIPRHRH